MLTDSMIRMKSFEVTERHLKEEIEQATREPSVATATSKHSSDKKPRKGSLSVTEGSICPTTPLESMVHINILNFY